MVRVINQEIASKINVAPTLEQTPTLEEEANQVDQEKVF